MQKINRFDLHMHTNHSSDGVLSIRDIYSVLNAREFDLFAVTDHNTVSSVREVLAFSDGNKSICYIPAVELSTYLNGTEIHVIPYGISPDDEQLKELLLEFSANRIKQAEMRVAKLQSLGFQVDYDRVMEVANGKTPSGVTFLNVLSENESNKSALEPYLTGDKSDSPYTNFYFDYFFKNGKAYVDVSLLDFNKTVEKLSERSVISIAHPGLYPQEQLDCLFIKGVEAMEVYSSYHNADKVNTYLAYVKGKNLLATAGSDFHGERIKPNIHLGEHGCSDSELAFKLLDKLSSKGCKVYLI
jgi:predicted metal-dependent phosphoesterase TrpH